MAAVRRILQLGKTALKYHSIFFYSFGCHLGSMFEVVSNSGCVRMAETWRRLESLRTSVWKPLPLWDATLREGHTHLFLGMRHTHSFLVAGFSLCGLKPGAMQQF